MLMFLVVSKPTKCQFYKTRNNAREMIKLTRNVSVKLRKLSIHAIMRVIQRITYPKSCSIT